MLESGFFFRWTCSAFQQLGGFFFFFFLKEKKKEFSHSGENTSKFNQFDLLKLLRDIFNYG